MNWSVDNCQGCSDRSNCHSNGCIYDNGKQVTKKWVSAGTPDCKHEGQLFSYCGICGYPLYQDKTPLQFIFGE